MMYLSSVLKKDGHTCDISIFDTFPDLKEIKEKRPDILAVSTTTGIHLRFLEACKQVKRELDLPIIFGGAHPTFFPRILEEESVDFICRGEGERPFLEFLSAFEHGHPPFGIKNIDEKHNGEIVSNGLRPFLQDLDVLPFPDRELVRGYSLFKQRWKSSISGRGCPYQCSYCFNHSMMKLTSGRWVRKRSVDNVVEEVAEIKARYSIRDLDFLDDTFILNEKWIEEFAEKFPKHVGLPFGCNVRANLVNDRICRLLREAGCIEVAMGVESGNDRLRNEVLKRDLNREQIIEAAKLIRKYGIRLITQNMIGLPGETTENALETVELNVKCRPDLSGFSFYQPYPGTQLCDYATSKGLFSGEANDVPMFFTRENLIQRDEREQVSFPRIARLFPLIYKLPVFFPLLRFSMGSGGSKPLKRLCYLLLVACNYSEKITFLPRGLLYILLTFVLKERTRYHFYKWFHRRVAFLSNKIRRIDSSHS